ncbi:recombinase RarA, partial [Staphylococcus aureus]
HLKDGHYQGAKDLGRSIGYKYPHQYVNGYVSQQYLPDKLKNKIYYEPKTTSKSEQQLKEIYNNLLKQRP